MSIGKPVSLAGEIVAQGELVVGAATARLSPLSIECSRVWLGAPTASHKRGVNTSLLLVGNGTSLVELAANPADGNTVTITGNGGATIYEFDNNSAVTGENVAVTIGSTAAATLANLAVAINTVGDTPCEVVSSILRAKHCLTIAKSGANITVTLPNRAGGFPIAVDNYEGVTEPVTDVQELYVSGLAASDAVEWKAYR